MPLQSWLYVPSSRAPCRIHVACANHRPTSAESNKPTSQLLHANDTGKGHRTVLPYESRPIGIAIPHGADNSIPRDDTGAFPIAINRARDDRCLPPLPRIRSIPSTRVRRILSLRYRSCMPGIGPAQLGQGLVGTPYLRNHGNSAHRTHPESLSTATRLDPHPSGGGYSHPPVFPRTVDGK